MCSSQTTSFLTCNEEETIFMDRILGITLNSKFELVNGKRGDHNLPLVSILVILLFPKGP